MAFNWSSVSSFLTNPNVGLSYNLGRGAIAGLGALFSRPQGGANSVAGLYQQAQAPFQQALAAQQQAYDMDALLYGQQADLAMAEANADAAQKAREVSQFREEQANRYNASGVLLEGSPLLVLDETRRLGQQEIDAIQRRGQATADLLRRRGAVGLQQGRAALLGQQAEFDSNRLRAIASANSIGAGGKGPLDFLSPLFDPASQYVMRNAATPTPKTKKQAPLGLPPMRL